MTLRYKKDSVTMIFDKRNDPRGRLRVMRIRMGKTFALWVADENNNINDLPGELREAAEQYLELALKEQQS